MAVVRRPNSSGNQGALSSALQLPLTILIFLVLFSLVLYVAVVPDAGEGPLPGNVAAGNIDIDIDNDHGAILKSAALALPQHVYQQVAQKAEQRLRSTVQHKREQLQKALDTLSTSSMPARLRVLRDTHQIVGERLTEIQQGQETVQEILHVENSDKNSNNNNNKNNNNNNNNNNAINNNSDKPPMELAEIKEYLTDWLHTLHDTLGHYKRSTYEGIWQGYHDLTVKTLYVWDREYLSRMPPRRDDGSIFLSIATYRDENCLNTVTWAYQMAKNPEKLFVGIVQQNCHADCKSGILEGGKIADVEPDQDCYKEFCEGDFGKVYCDNNQVRVLDINESESLGPYAARFFASKLWYGEQWYMQTDAHMTFKEDWDAISVSMLQAAPSKKPIISHYPPSHKVDLETFVTKPASRLCGPIFATSDLESQIIRLEGANNYDKVKLNVPRFAPFTAAGYFVAHSDFLREVPFDPFLPWIFMGEEIIMSTRLWTSGYDIFSPSQAVVGHIYVRSHKPKFWESVHRAFSPGVHNPLQAMVLDRIKYQLGYPEAAKDMLSSKTLLTAVEQYSMGTERSLERYLELVGLNMTTKEVTITHWCEDGKAPPGFEEVAHLYETE